MRPLVHSVSLLAALLLAGCAPAPPPPVESPLFDGAHIPDILTESRHLDRPGGLGGNRFVKGWWPRKHKKEWRLHEAALFGSSHYDLPGVLRWLSANIGIHHVHHLYARIPFYRLTQVLRDHPALSEVRRLTLLESFACVKLQLWDENQHRLVSYAEARAC